jgi:hypothetical protein
MIREILKMGDPRLLRVAWTIEDINDPALKAIIADMCDTYAANGRLGSTADRHRPTPDDIPAQQEPTRTHAIQMNSRFLCPRTSIHAWKRGSMRPKKLGWVSLRTPACPARYHAPRISAMAEHRKTALYSRPKSEDSTRMSFNMCPIT